MEPNALIAQTVLNFIGRVPTTKEVKSFDPQALGRSIALSASPKAALTARPCRCTGPLG